MAKPPTFLNGPYPQLYLMGSSFLSLGSCVRGRRSTMVHEPTNTFLAFAPLIMCQHAAGSWRMLTLYHFTRNPGKVMIFEFWGSFKRASRYSFIWLGKTRQRMAVMPDARPCHGKGEAEEPSWRLRGRRGGERLPTHQEKAKRPSLPTHQEQGNPTPRSTPSFMFLTPLGWHP